MFLSVLSKMTRLASFFAENSGKNEVSSWIFPKIIWHNMKTIVFLEMKSFSLMCSFSQNS